MLYPKNKEKMEQELFKNPTNEYRGAPFWAWNCELNDDLLKRQIAYLGEMGFGGVHIHSRTGLSTEYLSKDFFDLIKTCIDEAKRKDMLIWLYDEDRWPSGSAGGIVTKNHAYRARHLLFSTDKSHKEAESKIIGVYAVELDESGTLKNYRKLKADAEPQKSKNNLAEKQETIWYAYLVLAEESAWYNNQTYVNTLDKAAIDEFCRVTHEAYAKHIGNEFGKSINTIFTDEPQFTKKLTLGFAEEKSEVVLPWTDDLPDTFMKAYNESVLDKLPELIWDLPEGKPSGVRYHYHCHISERFAQAFADNLGNWCEKHNLKLTGHMMEEPTLESQTAALGEVMRSLSAFQLPGVDMLCDRREYNTVKQAQSIAHQYNREGVLSELYGVTNWDFDFRDHKLSGDWQAALGVTVRVPHLSWVAMEGEAKRDYPASINYQVPWYKEYPIIENHFARVNTAMTRGTADIKIGVIHPIESYWMYWGPKEQSAIKRKQLENRFKNLTEWLLFGQLDFDFISESVFPNLCQKAENPLKVGNMSYDVILVPGCETLRRTTVDILQSFIKNGGSVIFIGGMPKYINAQKDTSIAELNNNTICIPFDEYSVLTALEKWRTVSIYDCMGFRTDNLLCQLRSDKEEKWLFIAHSKQPKGADEGNTVGRDVMVQENIVIRIKGIWKPVVYDTITGEAYDVECSYKKHLTEIKHTFYGHDSLLLRLLPQKAGEGKNTVKPFTAYRLGRLSLVKNDAETEFYAKADIELTEQNVLVLDTAEYALGDEPYQPKEEILRLDNIIRARVGYPERKNNVAQPWAVGKIAPEYTIRLRFTFLSDINVKAPYLAIENVNETTVIFDGKPVEKKITGYYVDETISTIKLPSISAGVHNLELVIPFGLRTNTENCFILGDFGVSVQGALAKIVAPVKELAFSDITTQGLPFYGGNVKYKLNVNITEEYLSIRVPHYRGALVGIEVDGKREGTIVFAPYEWETENISNGRHQVTLILFGNRVNTFGALHNANENWWWHGPDAWRTFGDEFSYEYRLKKTGILKSPEIITKRPKN